MPGIGQHAVSFLQDHPGKKLTAREIVLAVLERAPKDFNEKRQALATSRPDVSFEQQLVAELGAQRPGLQRRYRQLMTDESVRPKLYYWNIVEDPTDTTQRSEPIPTAPLNQNAPAAPGRDGQDDTSEGDERPLYEPIRRHLHAELGILSVRIDERRSKNNRGPKGNQWLHPDIVGMLPTGAHWQTEVLQCAQSFGTEVAELWSFEVKVGLTAGTLRESFFQAVSNSTWATYGYLVATAVSGRDTWDELKMLCAAHGIGYISFNPGTPAESNIAIPARRRPQVDWNTVDRIASQNRDFQDYTKRVSAYLRSGFLDPASWGL